MLKYRQDALIVTTNYRLGALGFLGGPAVAATTRDGSAGNFGLQVCSFIESKGYNYWLSLSDDLFHDHVAIPGHA